jgi:hypothetical protein
MADYRDLAAALGGGYGQDTGGITPDTLITLKGGKKATASDLLGMIKEIGVGSLSNLESLVRGGVAQIPGAGGDLEGLARMGINKAFGAGGVNVNPTPILPTTTDILGMMPRKTAARPETAGMEELGGFMAPATAKLAGKAIKATEGMPVGMSIKDMSYRGQHTAPGPDFGAPLHDLTGGGQMYPADVYSEKAAQYYGSGNRKADVEAFNLAKQVRGNPDAEVTMYRAVPKNADISAINAGDWVTLSKDYAKGHGESALRGDYKILSQKVKAKDLWTNADSIQEFGYQPQ